MSKRADFALTAAALACVVLTCTRAVGVFHYGPYVFTSGREDEALFTIWKWINGQPIYANPFAPPFAQSYFNWLFYGVYGGFAWLVLSVGKLDFITLPLISHCLTLALTVGTVLVVYQLLGSLSFVSRVAGSVVIALNPLIGFWMLTARPDIGALVLALIGAWCVQKADRNPSFVWIAMAFLAFYCSWAFKQTYIAAFAATFIYLFLSGRRKSAIWFGLATAVAIGLTFMLGTPEYRYATVLSQSHMGLLPSIAGRNFGRALLKAPCFLFGLISLIIGIRRNRQNFFALWAIISIPLMLIASGKAGSSDNYFFEPAAACSILFLLEERYATAAAVAQTVAPILVLAGVVGWAFPQKPGLELSLLKTGLADMNGSVFITVIAANLPWIQKRPPNFVLATTYPDDKARGIAFEFGGVEGMVRSGRIDFLVCPRNEASELFDGIIPASLWKIKEDDSWAYFATRPPR